MEITGKSIQTSIILDIEHQAAKKKEDEKAEENTTSKVYKYCQKNIEKNGQQKPEDFFHTRELRNYI